MNPDVSSAKPTVARLNAVLAALRPHLRGEVTPEERPPARIDSAQLQRLLGDLMAPLAAARADGRLANPWTIAGLRRDEVRTAAVLAWLLDPSGSHGAGDTYAKALWRRTTLADRFSLAGLEKVVTEQRPLGDDFNRVDVVLEGADFLVFIEVKIGAPLRDRQLEDYADALARKAAHHGKRHSALLLLSIATPPVPDGCGHFSWRDAARAIREGALSLDRRAHAVRLALSFADHIDRL